MQGLVFIFYESLLDSFSTCFNRVMNIVLIFAARKARNYVGIEKTESNGDEPPHGGRI